MTERTVIASRMTDEEALLVRLAESIDRPGLDATSTLTLIASWLESEFNEGDFSDEASSRFRTKLASHKVDVEKLRVVVGNADRFPHRQERHERRDASVAKQMRWVRETVERLLGGTAADRPGGTLSRNTTNAPQSDTAQKVQRRLNRDDPEMAARVAANEISANAAAVQAGYRPRRISVRLDRPSSIAESLRKHLTPAQVAELRRLLDD